MKRAVLFLVVAGCTNGGSDPSSSARTLCDPVNPPQGRIALQSAGGGLEAPIDHAFANGTFLFVDAQCHYWASDPSSRWSETRTGTLDAATALDAGTRVHFGEWDELSGSYPGGAADAPNIYFDNGTRQVVCDGLCPQTPQLLAEMDMQRTNVTADLWDAGTAVDGGVRLFAERVDSPTPNQTYVDWPLARPITDFLAPQSAMAGVLEADATSAAQLRALRASFLANEHGTFMYRMTIKSGGDNYNVTMRDVLPFENANGVVERTGAHD